MLGEVSVTKIIKTQNSKVTAMLRGKIAGIILIMNGQWWFNKSLIAHFQIG